MAACSGTSGTSLVPFDFESPNFLYLMILLSMIIELMEKGKSNGIHHILILTLLILILIEILAVHRGTRPHSSSTREVCPIAICDSA